MPHISRRVDMRKRDWASALRGLKLSHLFTNGCSMGRESYDATRKAELLMEGKGKER
jgi:hypothetical protein